MLNAMQDEIVAMAGESSYTQDFVRFGFPLDHPMFGWSDVDEDESEA